MMNELEEMNLAAAAKRLLENPDYQAVLAAIDADINRAFRSVRIGNNEELAHIHALSQAHKLMHSSITKYITNEQFILSKTENH